MSTGSGADQKSSRRHARGLSQIDPAALMRIRNLELRARAVVEGFLSGLNRSPYHGFSVEFTEYREYSAGDDLRFLDWRLFARSDRYYLKRFEDETNLRCYLLLDLSRSMGFRSAAISYDKADYARTLAATLAYFLTLQRDAVGLISFDQTIRDYLPARYRPGHLHRLMMCLEKAVAGTETDLSLPLEQVARTARKRGLVILFSDLLAPTGELEQRLGYLRSQGHEVVLIRILDPQEIEFPFEDESLFLDLETGREIYVDPRTERESYLARFTTHADQVRQTCANLGIELIQMTTNQPIDLALFDFLNARLRHGHPPTRRAGMSRPSKGSR